MEKSPKKKSPKKSPKKPEQPKQEPQEQKKSPKPEQEQPKPEPHKKKTKRKKKLSDKTTSESSEYLPTQEKRKKKRRKTQAAAWANVQQLAKLKNPTKQTIKNLRDSAKRAMDSYAFSGKDAKSLKEELGVDVVSTKTTFKHLAIPTSETTTCTATITAQLKRCTKAMGDRDVGTESKKWKYIDAFVLNVIDEIDDDDLLLDPEGDIAGEEAEGHVEYVFRFKGENVIHVIEAKRNNMQEGLVQCVYEVKAAHDSNKKKKPVYGCYTDSVQWVWIKYDGGQWFKSNRLLLGDEFKATEVNDVANALKSILKDQMASFA